MTSCPIHCPHRRVGCRTDCPLWAQHEAEKARSYEERKHMIDYKAYKKAVVRRAIIRANTK
jgi:hypothetical protein